jgi:SiaC family regulatory phosphoprotein
MQKLYIAQTRSTPEINLSPDENIFFVRGVSSPEDVRAMYYPVTEWIKTFVNDIVEGVVKVFNKETPVKFTIDLSYFNSSSAKFLFDILTELKRLQLANVPIIIEWMHEPEDTDMRDAGTDFSQLVGMEFILLSKPKK